MDFTRRDGHKFVGGRGQNMFGDLRGDSFLLWTKVTRISKDPGEGTILFSARSRVALSFHLRL